MALPEHVKKQAMDAVSHTETTAQIRLYRNNDVPAQTFSSAEKHEGPTRSPIPDDVKKQAKDAVSHPETQAQIRLVKDNGSVSPAATPSQETNRIAGKTAQLEKSGHDADAAHQKMTKDNFGREHG
jgi:hypothetical protein